MIGLDRKGELRHYLQMARDALLWKLDGLSEYDVRRPMVPTGTNLLGLVKHTASMECGYFGGVFGRPFPETLPWFEEGSQPNDDMWATAAESREEIIGFYKRAWAHSDATLDALELDAVGRVPWWPAERDEVTLNEILARMIAETNRHGGHADLVRELIDGEVGYRRDVSNLPEEDEAWWAAYRERIEQAAREAASRSAD
jgi:hypothetical protein